MTTMSLVTATASDTTAGGPLAVGAASATA